ncbi:MAG: hypothetical protein CL677_01115 [Bdellovibrionaceae bacterium]|nr:hypothetical protein [Pseudobdellovibrionaceae bacterium]|tara:strand:- start:159 stop:410 length:252 start_codon:yes stop_codon:yes gene_type:complete
MGIYVELRQIDSSQNINTTLPIDKATPDEIKANRVQSVPFTIVADLKEKALLPPIRGFHSANEILRNLSIYESKKINNKWRNK